MPSKSIAQQHLMQAAEHGADFPLAQKLRDTMSHDQLHDFSVGSEMGKPQHVGPPMLKGSSTDIIGTNMSTLKNSGQSELDATKQALRIAKPHPNRHKNLGKFLHPKKA